MLEMDLKVANAVISRAFRCEALGLRPIVCTPCSTRPPTKTSERSKAGVSSGPEKIGPTRPAIEEHRGKMA